MIFLFNLLNVMVSGELSLWLQSSLNWVFENWMKTREGKRDLRKEERMEGSMFTLELYLWNT